MRFRLYIKYITLFFLITCIFPSQYLSAQYINDFRVNDDLTARNQEAASVDVDKNGNFVIVWRDFRDSSNGDFSRKIYAQVFNKNGVRIGNNFQVNLNNGRIATNACIAMNDNETFWVCWDEGRNDSNVSRIIMRLFNFLGQPLSSVIQVNNPIVIYPSPLTSGSIYKNNKNGKLIVAIHYNTPFIYSYKDTFVQIFDSLGNKVGNNILVNDTSGSRETRSPAVTIRNDGSFIVAWSERHQGLINNDIFMQLFNSSNQKVGMNRLVNDDDFWKNVQGEVDLSNDSIGNFVITWSDPRISGGSDFQIYAQYYNSNAEKVGTNFRVDQGLTWNRFNPSVKMRPDGFYVIGWSDYNANGVSWSPYFQRFNNNNQKIGNNHFVTNKSITFDKYFQDITLWNDRIITVWLDTRSGDYDVYCNIRSFMYPDSVMSNIRLISETPTEFKLFQNYPNPFNNKTIIEFSVPKTELIKLEVYNLLGQKAETLINNVLAPGTYRIPFENNELSSGIYYLKLSSENQSQIKKLIIIK